MPKSSQETSFRIETATEGDWPWIVQGEAEIAWIRLGHERQREVGRQDIEERVASQVARLREEEGFPNQAFVARTEDGTPAGFVWVARTHNLRRLPPPSIQFAPPRIDATLHLVT